MVVIVIIRGTPLHITAGITVGHLWMYIQTGFICGYTCGLPSPDEKFTVVVIVIMCTS